MGYCVCSTYYAPTFAALQYLESGCDRLKQEDRSPLDELAQHPVQLE